MNTEFIEEIDRAVRKSGYSDRAKYIRDAIVEKMERAGISVSPEVSSAPSKIGKGGRPKVMLPQIKYADGVHMTVGSVSLSPKVKEAADALEALALKKMKKKRHRS